MNKVFMGVEEIDFEVVFQSWSFKFLWKVVIKIFQNEKRNKKIVNFRVTCWSDVTREAGILRSMLELLLTVNLQIYIYVLRNWYSVNWQSDILWTANQKPDNLLFNQWENRKNANIQKCSKFYKSRSNIDLHIMKNYGLIWFLLISRVSHILQR